MNKLNIQRKSPEMPFVKNQANAKRCNNGAIRAKSGEKYELVIFNIINKTMLNNKKFNTQNTTELGSYTEENDLMCNHKNKNDIGIEIKKCKTPDWCQCKLTFNSETKKWTTSKNSKLPEKAQKLFNHLLEKVNLYDNDIPPFLQKNITHQEWKNIKKETTKWNDVYFDIPNDTISKMYEYKNNQYIQISDYGLYHLKNDVCKFDVPKFDVEQEIRIRTKIHSSCNKQGFCKISVMAACKPKNIKKLNKSKYSLDDINKLPQNLKYMD